MKIDLLITFLFVAWFSPCFSQTEKDPQYYPVNFLYKELKVHLVIDTSTVFDNGKYCEEYDTLGRKIAWYYSNTNGITKYKYEEHADTLILFEYFSKNDVDRNIYSRIECIYNNQGKIETYKSYHKTTTDTNTTDIIIKKFIYDNKNRLLTNLIYYKDNYPLKFSENQVYPDTVIKLRKQNVYSYYDNDQIVIRRQIMGGVNQYELDSLFYDSKFRLIKKVQMYNFSYVNDKLSPSLITVDSIIYADSAKILTRSEYRRTLLNDYKKMGSSDIYTEIYLTNGLLKRKYLTHDSYQLSDENIFIYYDYELYK